jgi:periplasmic copper chaperone A
MIRTFTRTAAAVATLLALSAPAFAHVTLEVQEAALGSTYKAIVRVPHGCGTEATNTVRVQIPEGFFNVKPMPNGTMVTEGVKEIVWSGGDLPNEFYDEFVFRGTFAGSLELGKFYFPTIQECATGEEAWIDVTGAENADMPAPSLTLIEGAHH